MARLTVAALALCLTPGAVLGSRVERDAAVSQQSVEGAHVCCLESLEPDFKVAVYHAGRGQSDVRECLLESVAKDCDSQAECESRCQTSMKGMRRYRDLLAAKAQKEAADAAAERAKIFDQADKELKAALEAAKRAYSSAVKGPQEQFAASGKVLEAKTQDRKAKEAVFSQARSAQEAAQKDFDAKTSAKDEAERQAAAAKAQTETAAQAAAAASKQAAEQKVADTTKQVQAKSQEASGYAPQPAPAACQDSSSASGAKDCCCSIDHEAVRVSGELFVDWGKCKGAKAYSDTALLSLPCGYLTPCDKCAYLICGKGMCP